jgi:hypothetical protein
VRFSYITSLEVKEKQIHILRRPKILPETANYKVLSLGNCAYVLESTCSITFQPSDPLAASNGRGMHGFVLATGPLHCQ